jgi:hypothetical protein
MIGRPGLARQPAHHRGGRLAKNALFNPEVLRQISGDGRCDPANNKSKRETS